MTVLEFNYNLSTISTAAERLWQAAAPHHIITLSGDLGAGKTTLVSHLCRYLQMPDAVSSPTFALVNEYRLTTNNKTLPLYHIDWYRLRSAEEGFHAGMGEYVEAAQRQQAYCIIEWPEKAPELLTTPHISVYIETTGPEERKMKISVVN